MNNCFVKDTSWVQFSVKSYMENKRGLREGIETGKDTERSTWKIKGLRGGRRDRQKYRKEN